MFLVALKLFLAVVLIVLGGFSALDAFRDAPVIPDPVLAIVNLIGYIALIFIGAELLFRLT